MRDDASDMSRWTIQQIAQAAPDDSSMNAARKLAVPAPWSEMGSTETLLWGKCQGSGRTPYQVSVDLTRPAYRCSCPSRKFPCKHALALLILWSTGDQAVADTDTVADFAAEWASRREQPKSREQTVPDLEAQSKRRDARIATMSAGLDELAVWLGDLARNGIAQVRQQGGGWWETVAARLVDAQLPGLAEQVRRTGSDIWAREDWAEHVLAMCGRWWTAINAWRRRDLLDADQMANLRAFLGWSYSTDEVRAADSIADRWTVLGVHHTDDGRLRGRRTWLVGSSTGEVVQVLDFAAGAATLPIAKIVGATLDGDLSRYPGSHPRRALLGDSLRPGDEAGGLPTTAQTVSDAMLWAAEQWARNPWAPRIPACIEACATTTHLVDADGVGVRMTDDTLVWSLLAETGGELTTLFVEIEQAGVRVLSAEVGGVVVAL